MRAARWHPVRNSFLSRGYLVTPTQNLRFRIELMSSGTTAYLLLGTVLFLTIYDLWAVSSCPQSTISDVINRSARDYPILPFILGIVFGHIFWPLR